MYLLRSELTDDAANPPEICVATPPAIRVHLVRRFKLLKDTVTLGFQCLIQLARTIQRT